MKPTWAVFGWAAVALPLAVAGCKAQPVAEAAAPSQTQAQAEQSAEPAAPESDPPASGRWTLVDVQVVLQSPAPDGVSGAQLAPQLHRDLQASGVARGPDEQGRPAEEVQLGVELAWQRVGSGGEPVALPAAATDGWLEVAALAQVEQRPPAGKKRGPQAERRTTVRLPLPAAQWGLSAGFLAPRLSRVAEQTAADALGQLWAHSLTTEALLPLLDEREVWKVAAALRELGERKHAAAATQVHKLVGDSRREVSVVALGAAGRLAQPGAVAAVQQVVEQPDSAEQLDAALVALAELQRGPEGASAQKLLRSQAETAALPLVRLRARQLLLVR